LFQNKTDHEVNSVNTCGEALVGEKGLISFTFNHRQYKAGTLTCVWTVRAKSKSKINFKYDMKNLGAGSLVTITPLSPLLITSDTSAFVDKDTVILR